MLFFADVYSLKEDFCYKYFVEEEPLGIFFSLVTCFALKTGFVWFLLITDLSLMAFSLPLSLKVTLVKKQWNNSRQTKILNQAKQKKLRMT